jgi:hypothetical protein
MRTHQSGSQISFVLYTFSDWDVPVHPAGSLVRYKRQHPRMKFASHLSKARFSLHSTKNISRADSSILCAFWQQRCGRISFEGWRDKGRVRRVVLGGQVAFEDGRILAESGYGRNVRT